MARAKGPLPDGVNRGGKPTIGRQHRIPVTAGMVHALTERHEVMRAAAGPGVRPWARANGYAVADGGGPIPASVADAYRVAYPVGTVRARTVSRADAIRDALAAAVGAGDLAPVAGATVGRESVDLPAELADAARAVADAAGVTLPVALQWMLSAGLRARSGA